MSGRAASSSVPTHHSAWDISHQRGPVVGVKALDPLALHDALHHLQQGDRPSVPRGRGVERTHPHPRYGPRLDGLHLLLDGVLRHEHEGRHDIAWMRGLS